MHTISGEPVLEGKYHLESRIGQGGMGVVYKARHAYLKTQHAIKIILPDLVGNDPQLVTRFRQEALAAAAIRHQNVVQVTDYGVAQGTMPFLVMEFVEGEDLHDYLEREKRVSPEKAFEMISAICNGIGVAHNQGIVHRDMKPLNIMIVKGKSNMHEAVKILDFGLAKIKSGELLGSFIQAQTTGLMGSPYYMAPEQWSDDDLDARSDIYSIGIMLYQMLAGDVPFKGSSIPAIMKKHLTDEAPKFAEKGITDISPEVEKVVLHTLRKKRDERTSDVNQLIEEFRSALGQSSPYSTAANFQVSSAPLPVSSLSVLTIPPKSKVYLDDVSIGETENNGWLQVEGVRSGNHQLRISHDGFEDWESSLLLDGNPKQVVAELQQELSKSQVSIPKPAQTMPFSPSGEYSQQNLENSQQSQPIPQNTLQQQQYQTGNQSILTETVPKSSFASPMFLAIIGISGLLLLTVIGGVGAYMSGLIGGTDSNTAVSTPTNSANSGQVEETVKKEMVMIPGGTFMMGRNDGEILEKPEHQVKVDSFWLDKTEVTNEEYGRFVTSTNYRPPINWVNGKPVMDTEESPVRFVNIEDVNSYIRWRSKKDGVEYRLPTEAEWEYAARNGSENNLYPWGDKWDKDKAVISRELIFEDVGTKPEGKNKWGVLDLVGNVWEWTVTPASAFPKAPAELEKQIESNFKDFYVVKGSFSMKNDDDSVATSTVRTFSTAKNRDKAIGFRLARDDK
jgi:serine/threonine-protein kinase